ncbi:hypothetical protein [Rhizobium sp. MHM7A]|uniref:hypothetical protein n=1 Tax=Rhizobium sp. MHM7A TaxID=2583233 RepID=UPI0011060921|nr:hypothetical protein [Rhizobium sp. MHM7A]TLX16706.1 hypothetical protein FFR93_05020 [Rhizobium sp. MHM7A]
MSPFPNIRRRQDILFVCGADRSLNAATIMAELTQRKSGWIACFAEVGKPDLNIAAQLQLARFEVSFSDAAQIAPVIRSADIAILEGLPCALSDIVSTTWQAKCDLIGEILTETIEDAFSQIRIHFLKHWYGDTAKRAERVRVFFEGQDVTAEFRAHEERTRLRYPPMNTQVANPGSRDNYHM